MKIANILSSEDGNCNDFNLFKDTAASTKAKLEECKKTGKMLNDEDPKNGKFYAVYKIINKNFMPYFEFLQT